MKLSKLEKWLKFVIIGMGLCGAVVYGWGLPHMGAALRDGFPEFSHWYYPWLVFLWITALPCYGVLICAWRVAGNIGRGNAFSYDNGKAFRGIFYLTMADTLFFLVGNTVLWLLGRNHPAILAGSLILVFFGVAICVCAKALSHLVGSAADLQEENNLTI